MHLCGNSVTNDSTACIPAIFGCVFVVYKAYQVCENGSVVMVAVFSFPTI